MYITGGRRRMEPCWHQSWHWQAELSLSSPLSLFWKAQLNHTLTRPWKAKNTVVRGKSPPQCPSFAYVAIHVRPSLLLLLFFLLSDSFIQVEEEEKTIPESASSTFMKLTFFTMEMDGIFDIVSIHQFPRHLFMALFMRRIGQERNEFLCLCGRLRMMMILPHVSSLIFPETGPALSPLHSPAHNRRRRSRRRRTLHGVLLPRHSFPFHSTSHFYESNMFQ